MLQRTPRAVARGGFTLMEMLVVVAILVVLAGAAVPIYMKYLDDAKKSRAQIDLKTLSDVCETYYIKHGEYPASLMVLIQPGEDGSRPYLEQANLIDPWNREYMYTPQGQHNAALGRPDIWSNGPRMNDQNGLIGNWMRMQ